MASRVRARGKAKAGATGGPKPTEATPATPARPSPSPTAVGPRQAPPPGLRGGRSTPGPALPSGAGQAAAANGISTGHLRDLQADPANLRLHTPRGQGTLEDALKDVGAARSIVVDEDHVVMAGNGVVDAAANAGIERVKFVEADGNEIVAVVRRGLTPEQKKRLAIYDNRTGELSSWDYEGLSKQMQEMVESNGKVELYKMGWTDAELDALLSVKWEPPTLGAGDDGSKINWEGMPEFVQDNQKAVRTILVHFSDVADVPKFAALVKQNITDTTKFLWFPEAEIVGVVDKKYTTKKGAA